MSINGSESSSPGGPATPKFGTVVPNRIFVGGISANTSEAELSSLFSKYGTVKATKIIMDKAGISKGYGFVTFETEEEAQKILKEVDGLVLKDRKLNIASAVKKQPFCRVLGDTTQVSNGTIVYQSSMPQPYGGASLLTGRDNLYLPQAPYSLMMPQPVYLPQCHYQSSAGGGYQPQYVYAAVSPGHHDMYHYGSAMAQPVASPDYAEQSSENHGEASKQYQKQSIVPTPASQGETKTLGLQSSGAFRFGNSGNSTIPSSIMQPHPYHLQHHVVAKTVNGLTVMAYPGSYVMGTPTILHVKDSGGNEQDGMMTELGFLHSPIGSGALTPPPTPLPISCDFNSNNGAESARKN